MLADGPLRRFRLVRDPFHADARYPATGRRERELRSGAQAEQRNSERHGHGYMLARRHVILRVHQDTGFRAGCGIGPEEDAGVQRHHIWRNARRRGDDRALKLGREEACRHGVEDAAGGKKGVEPPPILDRGENRGPVARDRPIRR